MVQIKFKKFGANTAFGGFAPGDILKTNEAMARHLVDSGVAEYDLGYAAPGSPFQAVGAPLSASPAAPASPPQTLKPSDAGAKKRGRPKKEA